MPDSQQFSSVRLISAPISSLNYSFKLLYQLMLFPLQNTWFTLKNLLPPWAHVLGWALSCLSSHLILKTALQVLLHFMDKGYWQSD